jgi:hypothetical protein
MGMDTKLSDYTKEYNTADFIVKRFDERGWKVWEKQNITLDKVKAIVKWVTTDYISQIKNKKAEFILGRLFYNKKQN